ncbi:hypothetical protein FC99_GL000053 [Levilactobacillus koreensis JCM 16448]|nr:hypothetical protein FC99_GL000053 [Levilactobacillus koreensis JCM 16448]
MAALSYIDMGVMNTMLKCRLSNFNVVSNQKCKPEEPGMQPAVATMLVVLAS